MRLTPCKDLVLQILSRCPETRDNDNLLILKVWAHQNPKLRDLDFTFVNFSKEFLSGKYYPTNSILRCRRKLQEANEGLRGEAWEERHGKEAEEVKSDLKELDWSPNNEIEFKP